MLDKLILSGLAGVVAYSAQPKIKKYLETQGSAAKELLPGRLESTFIATTLAYLGSRAYEKGIPKIGNPFPYLTEDLKRTSIADLGQLALGAYTHMKVRDNSKHLENIGQLLSQLGNALSKAKIEDSETPA